jgi:hypothetical protein
MKVALLLMALLQTATPARIGNVVGSAEVTGKDGTAVARIGGLLAAGDRLRTLGASYLALSTDSGAVLQLGPNTRVELKKVESETWVSFTEGSLQVRTTGKPLRIETRYGHFLASEDLLDARFAYAVGRIEASVLRGSLRTESLDSANVVFKGGTDTAGERTYQAGGEITPGTRSPADPSLIIIPRVNVPTPRPTGPVVPTK